MHLVILSGTVFGTADLVADEAQSLCEAAGLRVSRLRLLNLDALLALQPEALLVCTSTTGMGGQRRTTGKLGQPLLIQDQDLTILNLQPAQALQAFE